MRSITISDTGGLGPVELQIIASGGTITPASRLVAHAVGTHRELLSGTGIDWGAGTGLLAILLSRIETVGRVVALEKDPDAVANARRNAGRSGGSAEITVLEADSFSAVTSEGQTVMDALRHNTDFLVANPPASGGDDGLEWRRSVLRGATEYLTPNAPILMQVSAQYSEERIRRLATDTGHTYVGLVESSDWAPFELDRDDLWTCLTDYVAEEQRGGLPYAFGRDGSETAVAAMDRYRRTGEYPITRWQVHQFRSGPSSQRA